MSNETRRKISEAQKRNPVRYWLGKHLSEEHCRKMSKALKGRSPSFLGHHHSKAALRKISEASKHRIVSEETRRKMRKARRNYLRGKIRD